VEKEESTEKKSHASREGESTKVSGQNKGGWKWTRDGKGRGVYHAEKKGRNAMAPAIRVEEDAMSKSHRRV